MEFWFGLVVGIVWMVITIEICRKESAIYTKFDYAMAVVMALMPLVTFFLGLRA